MLMLHATVQLLVAWSAAGTELNRIKCEGHGSHPCTPSITTRGSSSNATSWHATATLPCFYLHCFILTVLVSIVILLPKDTTMDYSSVSCHHFREAKRRHTTTTRYTKQHAPHLGGRESLLPTGPGHHAPGPEVQSASRVGTSPSIIGRGREAPVRLLHASSTASTVPRFRKALAFGSRFVLVTTLRVPSISITPDMAPSVEEQARRG
ncbi:hypothetical protein J3F83DRAFT_270961 [Trichoderma novae-zelandiae]